MSKVIKKKFFVSECPGCGHIYHAITRQVYCSIKKKSYQPINHMASEKRVIIYRDILLAELQFEHHPERRKSIVMALDFINSLKPTKK